MDVLPSHFVKENHPNNRKMDGILFIYITKANDLSLIRFSAIFPHINY